MQSTLREHLFVLCELLTQERGGLILMIDRRRANTRTLRQVTSCSRYLVTEHGVEIAIPIDPLHHCGLHALAECHLGSRKDRH